jgi:hypothetical protein
MKVAFCDFPVLFRHAIQSITGFPEDTDYLRFLSIVFKSKLLQYYLFHTSANWGSERDKVHLDELLSIPFFLPDKAPKTNEAIKCVRHVVEIFAQYEKQAKKSRNSLKNNNLNTFNVILESQKVYDQCEPFIRQYYGINRFEGHLIDDTIQYIIPSVTPASVSSPIPVLKPVETEQCKTYANELLDMLKAFAWKEKGYPYSAHVYLPGSNQYGIIRIDRSYGNEKKITTSTEDEYMQTAIRQISKHIDQHESDRIIHCLNLKVFDGDSLFILKPVHLRFWTRIAAQNDADEIGGSIAQQFWGDR